MEAAKFSRLTPRRPQIVATQQMLHIIETLLVGKKTSILKSYRQ